MGPSGVLVAATLGFSGGDARALELEVVLARAATVAVVFDERVERRERPAERHTLGPFPLPRGAPARWSLEVAGTPTLDGEVPDFDARPLRVVVLGADGSSPGPQRVLAEAAAALRPHIVLLTAEIPAERLRAFGAAHRALASAPHIGIARGTLGRSGDAPVVEVGPLRVHRIAQGALRGARAPGFDLVLAARGPLGSGPRGGDPGAGALALAEAGAELVVSGQDAHYERLGRGRTAFVVSGGGRAGLDPATRLVERSAGTVPAHHFVTIEVSEDGARLAAWSLDGLLLDRVRLPPDAPFEAAGSGAGLALALAAVGLGVLAGAVLVARA